MDSKIAHHRRIASILESMDGDFLAKAGCVFAGGTAIAMRLDNYRLSADIDFLCSSRKGYSLIRQAVGPFSSDGLSVLFRRPVTQLREVRADRYGIRTVLEADGVPIKFEIVSEGHIHLAPSRERLFGVPLIRPTDAFATKLLANSDRWADRSVLSRDLLDLAGMVDAWGPIPRSSKAKARTAYGGAVMADLKAAAAFFQSEEEYRERCFHEMHIEPDTQGRLLSVIEHLAREPAQGHAFGPLEP